MFLLLAAEVQTWTETGRMAGWKLWTRLNGHLGWWLYKPMVMVQDVGRPFPVYLLGLQHGGRGRL